MHYVLARAIKTPHEACKIREVTGQFSCSMLLRLWKLFRFLSKNGIPSAHGQLGHFPVRHPLGLSTAGCRVARSRILRFFRGHSSKADSYHSKVSHEVG